MKISRKRWVVIRNGKEIFCGLARAFKFKAIDDIGDTAIKTYLSRNKAIASFQSSWNMCADDIYEVVEVTETISTKSEADTE
jgi:hypothetical protein